MHTPQHGIQQIAQTRQIAQQLMQQTQQGTQQYQQMLQQEQQNAQLLQQMVQREKQAAQMIQQSLQGHQTAMQMIQQVIQLCDQMQQELTTTQGQINSFQSPYINRNQSAYPAYQQQNQSFHQ